MGNQKYYISPSGKKLHRVTSILGLLDKPALVPWAANMACDYILQEIAGKEPKEYNIHSIIEQARKNYRKVSKAAADIGTLVHEAIKYYLKTGKEPLNLTDKAETAFIAFLEWKDTVKLKMLEQEITVYDSLEMYAGTFDMVAEVDGKKTLIDFKAAKAIYPEYRYQIAAYWLAYPGIIERSGILRLDKETGFPEYVDCTDTYPKDIAIFRKLAELNILMKGEIK
jgi:hypothetical protein